jgi:GT2 family glycosyltransferase
MAAPADLAVVVVSHDDARWLAPCLSSVLGHAGDATLEIVVVSNRPGDGTVELVRDTFPSARVISCANRGFAHGNNRGALITTARYVLFLNPDTEVLSGTFGELVAQLDRRTEVGVAGVRQVTADGELYPTMRRFPNAARALGDALSSERWPLVRRLGEREVDAAAYNVERDCDWMSGSFMLARREALLGAGLMDERFFLYCEEPDLCLRVKRAGWAIRHLPAMTIVHHAGKGGLQPRMVAQEVFARRQYATKHFSPAHRALYLSAVGTRWALRAAPLGRDPHAAARRAVARHALRTLAGRAEPPFGPPPSTSVSERA